MLAVPTTRARGKQPTITSRGARHGRSPLDERVCHGDRRLGDKEDADAGKRAHDGAPSFDRYLL